MKQIQLFLVIAIGLLSTKTQAQMSRPDPPLPMVSYVGKTSNSREVKNLISWLKQNGYEKDSKNHYKYFIMGEGSRYFHFYYNDDKTLKAVLFSEPFLVTEDGLRPDATNAYADLPFSYELRVSCDGEKANIDLPGGLMLYSAPTGYYSTLFPEFIVGYKPEVGQRYNHIPAYVEGIDQDRYALPHPARTMVSFNLDAHENQFTCISGNCRASSSPEWAEVEWEGGVHYEGMFANGLPNGHGTITAEDPGSDSKTVYEGSFTNGLLAGEFQASQFNYGMVTYQLNGVTDEEGRVIEAEGKTNQSGQTLFIEFSTRRNSRLDLSEADPNRVPGSMVVYSSRVGRKTKYDYVIHSTGYLMPFCLHTFKGCNGNFVQSDIEGEGDYRSAVFENGVAVDYDGPVDLLELCDPGNE